MFIIGIGLVAERVRVMIREKRMNEVKICMYNKDM